MNTAIVHEESNITTNARDQRQESGNINAQGSFELTPNEVRGYLKAGIELFELTESDVDHDNYLQDLGLRSTLDMSNDQLKKALQRSGGAQEIKSPGERIRALRLKTVYVPIMPPPSVSYTVGVNTTTGAVTVPIPAGAALMCIVRALSNQLVLASFQGTPSLPAAGTSIEGGSFVVPVASEYIDCSGVQSVTLIHDDTTVSYATVSFWMDMH